MTHTAGIEVSLETSCVCIVDANGRVVRELTVESEPEALATALVGTGLTFARVGLEAGPLSQWLHAGLTRAGLPALLIETRRLRAARKTMPVKTDRNDARAIAQVVCTGWFRAVHVKSVLSQEVRGLLGARKLLVGKVRDLDNAIRALLRGFGLKVGKVGERAFAERTRDLVEGCAALEARWSALKAWGMAVAKRAGMRRAKVALARKLAVTCWTIWQISARFGWR